MRRDNKLNFTNIHPGISFFFDALKRDQYSSRLLQGSELLCQRASTLALPSSCYMMSYKGDTTSSTNIRLSSSTPTHTRQPPHLQRHNIFPTAHKPQQPLPHLLQSLSLEQRRHNLTLSKERRERSLIPPTRNSVLGRHTRCKPRPLIICESLLFPRKNSIICSTFNDVQNKSQE